MSGENIWRKLLAAVESPRIVTLIGGGGKTTLLWQLQRLCLAANWPAVASCTTKLSENPAPWPAYCRIDGPAALTAAAVRSEANAVVSAEPAPRGKVCGVPPEWIDAAAAALPQALFLVEGDGSAGRPLKGHLQGEPVIPTRCGLVIVVIGLDCIGRKLDERIAHRPQRVAELASVQAGTTIDAALVCRLLKNPNGWLRACPAQSDVAVYLNKTDLPGAREQAGELAQLLKREWGARLRGVVSGSLHQAEFYEE